MLAIQQPLAALKLCLLYSSLWLPSSFDCYTAALIQLDKAAVGCLQALLAYFACYTALLAIQQLLVAFKLYLLYSSLWLPSRFACYTAVFCCLQVLLAIQQPLAAFKLCLLYSSFWLPSNFACHRAAFDCLKALLAIKQPLAAFKLCLLYSSLWLPSSFDRYTTS